MLITIYKSLAISHFRYRATVLVTAIGSIKRQMSVFHNRILRIINISKAKALAAYGISDIASFLESSSSNQVRKLLTDSTSPVARSLLSSATKCLRNSNFLFSRTDQKNPVWRQPSYPNIAAASRRMLGQHQASPCWWAPFNWTTTESALPVFRETFRLSASTPKLNTKPNQCQRPTNGGCNFFYILFYYFLTVEEAI